MEQMEKLEQFKRETREKLQKEKQRLETLKERIERTTFSGSQEDVYGEISTPADNYPADYGTETFARELDWTIARMIEKRESEINKALERLDHDRYGMCEVCGLPIDPERLEVRPDATLCIYHQRQMELSRPRYAYGDHAVGDVSSMLGMPEEEEGEEEYEY